MAMLSKIKRILRQDLVRNELKKLDVTSKAINERLVKIESLLGSIQKQNEVAIRAAGRPIRVELNEFLSTNQFTPLETLKLVKEKRLSLARFGDGELRCMSRYGKPTPFQRGSAKLENALKDVFSLNGYDESQLLITIPDGMSGNHYWEAEWPELWISTKHLFNTNQRYGNTVVSRSQFFHHYQEEAVSAWREIWDGKDVWVLTGEGSRFEPVEALFSGVKSLNYLYSKAVDAFVDLPRFKKMIVDTVPTGSLCLIALGPSGTVLAADLSKAGYWALDVGHINACYREAIENGPKPERLALVR